MATQWFLLPLLLLMNRKRFESLPAPAQMLIRKYSGEPAAAAWIESFGDAEREQLDKIRADPERKVVVPSPSDWDSARQIYQSMIDAWAAKSAHNRALLARVRTEIAGLRKAKEMRQ